MNILLGIILAALIGYLLGSVNFAVIVSRVWAKDDVRNHGSGNAGMTNMLRTYGILPGVLTILGDFLKGVLAVVLARTLFAAMGIDLLDGGYPAGFFALLGHLYPVYFGFRGGKGVVTTVGIAFVLNPLVPLIILAVELPVIFATRIISIASLTGAVLYPVATFAVLWARQENVLFETLFAALMAAMIIYMHRDNIRRLLSKTEKKLVIKRR